MGSSTGDEGHESEEGGCSGTGDEGHEGKAGGRTSNEGHEGEAGGRASNEGHEGKEGGRSCAGDEGHESKEGNCSTGHEGYEGVSRRRVCRWRLRCTCLPIHFAFGHRPTVLTGSRGARPPTFEKQRVLFGGIVLYSAIRHIL